jgi:ferredoxin--NADP+ reductase
MAKTRDNFHYLKSISREARRKDGSKFYVQSQLEDEEDLLSPMLQKDNTLIYICGMKGMEIGIYKQLVRLNLLDYVDIRKELPDLLDEIPSDKFKRYIKSADRTFEEVY